MKKATFYRIMLSENQIIAVKIQGYVEGDIGVHKENEFWVATHIPTGLKLIPAPGAGSNTRAATFAAAKLVLERSDCVDKIQKHILGVNHAKFLNSKYNQTATEVY